MVNAVGVVFSGKIGPATSKFGELGIREPTAEKNIRNQRRRWKHHNTPCHRLQRNRDSSLLTGLRAFRRRLCEVLCSQISAGTISVRRMTIAWMWRRILTLALGAGGVNMVARWNAWGKFDTTWQAAAISGHHPMVPAFL
jgi:hypothetical protein